MSLRCAERSMFSKIVQSPALVRVVPFALFLTLTFLQDRFGEAARYWIYCGKTLAGAAMLPVLFRYIAELEWRLSWAAVVVGVGVFVMWIGLEGHYPSLDAIYRVYLCPILDRVGMVDFCATEAADHKPWNPNAVFGLNSPLAIFFIVSRIIGSTFVVPPLEEAFYRSFVYRFLASKDFLSVPL